MKHPSNSTHGEQAEAAQKQMDLFWLRDPHSVISLVQLMQFGYAMQLAIVIMFWSDLGDINPLYFLVATLVCYSTFVFVLAKVLPQYTLCTSLGSLVDKTHLQETVALHRLHEAQRRQKRKQIEFTFDADSLICLDEDVIDLSKTFNDSKTPSWEDPTEKTNTSSKLLESGTFTSQGDSSSGDSHVLATRDDEVLGDSVRFKAIGEGKSTLLAELVKMDTAALRQQLPERNQNRLLNREQRMKDRRSNRKKAVSDGVQAMRSMSTGAFTKFSKTANGPGPSPSDPADSTLQPNNSPKADEDRASRRAARRANRKKAVSSSAVIQAWQNVSSKAEDALPQPGKSKDDMEIITKTRSSRRKSASASDVVKKWQGLEPLQATEGPRFIMKNDKQKEVPSDPEALYKQLRSERRQRRKKAVSESAVIQSWRDFSVTNDKSSEPELTTMTDTYTLDKRPASVQEDSEVLPGITEESNFFSPSKQEDHAFEETAAPDETDAPLDSSASRVVNLSDAQILQERDDPPITKKSVGFSTITSDDDDDSLIVPGKMHEDDSTVDTGRSVGELSDVADVARHEFETMRSNIHWEESFVSKLKRRLSPEAIRKRLNAYFVGPLYPVFSHVFGSVVVFFLIGMRIEAMNAATGAFDPSENTWELKLKASFWWQATWYMLFICGDVLAMWSVHSSQCRSIPERRLFVAAVLDLLLAALCLTLLFVAEAQRCCEDEYYELGGYRRALVRLLAGEEAAGDDYAASSSGAYDDDIYSQCCPFWGFRTYGGLGNIEPFTALIGIRTFRYFIAKYVVLRFWAADIDKKDNESKDGTEEDHVSDDRDHAGHHGGHGHSHGHGGDMRAAQGSALQLWEQAISKYPDIVEKYGQFSGELFQAMLGLEIVEDAASRKSLSLPTSVVETEPESEIHNPESDATHPHYKLAGENYSSLSAESQCIILAGKLGKPVKSMANLMVNVSSGVNLPTLLEDAEVHSDPVPSGTGMSTEVEFEVDDKLLEEEEKAESPFIAPNARLVRSMRRCDRRLYPLLKEWVTVDVVMTQFEIVYFDIHEEASENDEETKAKAEALRLALQATKGGKGLRLMDVAAGRKVVGHLDLSEVTQVHVQRDMPLLDVSHLESGDSAGIITAEPRSEYWLKDSHVEVHFNSRTVRWAKIKEDRLKLVSIHGTLLLRYYSDLNDIESHMDSSMEEDELFGPLKKDISLQWAQTIAHMCGTEQLKQALPHFGSNSSEELRDYLEVNHHAHRGDESRGLRRQKSMHTLSERSGSRSQSPKPARRHSLRHSVSLGEDGGRSVRKLAKNIFSRSSSMGNEDTPRSERSNRSPLDGIGIIQQDEKPVFDREDDREQIV